MNNELDAENIGCHIREVDFDSFDPHPINPTAPKYQQKPPPLRRTELVDEPRRLYNAMSYLTWKTGLCFNAHVTLTAAGLGFSDYKDFLALMPHWHKEMNRCLFGGTRKAVEREGQLVSARRVSRRDLVRVEHPHYWMGVLEYARDHGVHVHVLCVLPKYAVEAFREKTWAWWGMKSPGVVEPNGIAFRVNHPTLSRSRYGRQVKLFQYIIKTTAVSATTAGQKRTDPDRAPNLPARSERLHRCSSRSSATLLDQPSS